MSNVTHVDELINSCILIINKLASSKEVTGLILNNQNIDMASEDAEKVYDHLYDYDYVDDTIQEACTVVTVCADMARASSPTMKHIKIYIHITCSKDIMRLKGFRGVKGNRAMNIVRQIDLLLNGSREFGIGRLQLEQITNSVTTKPFASVLMTYSIEDFAHKRELMPR